jgi:uncharacterized OsmC-like protein
MTEQSHRSVTINRIAPRRFTAVNIRGGELTLGDGEDETFTPIELLLAGLAGCSAIDVDIITSRRAQPKQFAVTAQGKKVRDEAGNHLADLELVFRVRFPDDTAGDAARAVLPDVMTKSHDRLCTVSRTVELGTPVTVRAEPAA